MNFNQIMLPILENMPPTEREKLLLVLRELSHPRAYPWIDTQLALLKKEPKMPGRRRQQLKPTNTGHTNQPELEFASR